MKFLAAALVFFAASSASAADALHKCTGESPSVAGDHAFRIHILQGSRGLKATLLEGKTEMNTWATYQVSESSGGGFSGKNAKGFEFNIQIQGKTGKVISITAPGVDASGGSSSGVHTEDTVTIKNAVLSCEE